MLGATRMRSRHATVPALALAALSAACSSPSSSASSDAPAPDLSDAATGVASENDASSPLDSSAASPPPNDDGGATSDASTTDAALDAGPPARQSLIWVWQDYADTLGDVTSHASSFTHVSPALYQLNYAYSSGTAQLLNTDDNFSGLSSAQIAKQVHAAGLKCVPMMYAGAGNDGTDQGIQNVLDDSPSGAQSSFISSMVQEAVTKGYDGYNLDWEVGSTDDTYSAKYVAFLTAFKSALHAQKLTLSVDIAGWYILQCSGSGGTGLVDLTQLGPAVDQAILEDYSGAFDDTTTSCPAPPPSAPASQDCDTDFGGGLDAMCNLPPGVVSIGLISTGTNPFADRALAATAAYGFRSVAVWPDDAQFLNGSNIPNGATWYSLLAGFLAN